jgi:hypothetical protein
MFMGFRNVFMVKKIHFKEKPISFLYNLLGRHWIHRANLTNAK